MIGKKAARPPKKATRAGREKLTASLDGWANALGRERRTLERILTRNGISVKPGQKFSAKDIYAGIAGDEQVERVRNLRLDANEKERDAKKADGALVEWELVEREINSRFINPLIAALDAAPDSVSREWVEKVLKPTLRQQLQKPKTDK